jgi:hypothetical protein
MKKTTLASILFLLGNCAAWAAGAPICPGASGANSFIHSPDALATGCNVVITLNANGTATVVVTDPAPYDGTEDTLIGVVNNSTTTVTSLPLAGSDIFGFDGDGICTFTFVGDGYCTAGQKAGGDPGDYQGPTSTFAVTNANAGTVYFSPGIPGGGGTTYFSLEGVPTTSITVGGNLLTPTFAKAFGGSALFASAQTSLTFTITNPNTGALTGLAFSDTLPVGLLVATPNALTDSCGGTATAVAGSNSIALSGGTLAPSASCTVVVNVTGISPGTQVNTTSSLTSNAPTAAPATASILVYPTLDGYFQVSYAADPSAGESYINIINTGANGAALLGPGFGGAAGNICVNVYAFAPDEQEISCCSCLLTPNSVANLGVNRDLTSTTVTGLVPSSVVIKLVSTLAGVDGTGTSCASSAAVEGTLANGLVAYGTTPQPVGTAFSAVEHRFIPSTLSAGEFASITGRCAAILGNGSGFGVCNSCKAGALGAGKQQ